jgi:hypothetical protein
MLATGGLLVSIAALALAIVGPVFRRSDPPRWTTRGWIGELVTLAIVCTLALGLGYLGAGIIGAWQAGPDFLDVALLALVLLVAVAIGRRLTARARATAVGADATGYARTAQFEQADSGGLVTLAGPAPLAANEPPRPTKAA